MPAQPARQREYAAHRQQPACESGQLHAQQGGVQEDAQHRAQARSGRYAQDVGRHQGIAEHGLVGGARRRQGRAHQQGRRNAGQAQLPYHPRAVVRLPRSRARRQGVQHLPAIQRIGALPQGQNDQDRQDEHQARQQGGIGKALRHAPSCAGS